MADVKITKRMVLMAIADYVGNHDFEATVDGVVITADDVDAYVSTTLEQIDKKNAKAAERAAQKRAEGDNLRELVYSYVGEDLSTVDEIAAKVAENEGYEDITNARIVARLTQLVKANMVAKESVKTESGRKVMAYHRTEA